MSAVEEIDGDFDDYDDEDEEGGLSGFVVLLMGVVMLGAFASVVYIAYQQGLRSSANNTPYVAADPDPIKIENAPTVAVDNRAVYDSLEGRADDDIEIIANVPEEPVERRVDDAIGAIVGDISDETGAIAPIEDDAVADRIAALEAADETLVEAVEETIEEERPSVPAPTDALGSIIADVSSARDESAADIAVPAPAQPVRTTPAAIEVPDPTPAIDPLSGSHLVQIGAFRSDDEAGAFWRKLEQKMGGYLDAKAKHVERADLGDRGVYHRLRIGPFSSATAARTYCEGLKSRGQDCLIRAK